MQAGGGGRTVIDDTSGMTFAPRFSPDGRRAVFSMTVGTGSDIFVTEIGGRGHTQLTRSSSIDTAPAFSPDGNWIVFESDRGGTQQLYIMPASGGGAAGELRRRGATPPRRSPRRCCAGCLGTVLVPRGDQTGVVWATAEAHPPRSPPEPALM